LGDRLRAGVLHEQLRRREVIRSLVGRRTADIGWFNELSSGDVTPGAVRAQVGTKTVAVSWSTAASSGARTGQFMFIYSAA
jgi:hypothetical protein